MTLFNEITYYISPSLPPTLHTQLDAVLQANGATQATSSSTAHESPTKDPKLNLVISESLRFDGWEEVAERRAAYAKNKPGGDLPEGWTNAIEVVTPNFIERSVIIAKLQSPQHFSTDPSFFFSGVIATGASDLPPADLEVLSAGITGLGGQWRSSLTAEITHLFALTPTSPKYQTAMHFREDTGIKVVLPHWFDDCVRLGVRGLSEEMYEWPECRVLKGPEGLLPTPKEREKAKAAAAVNMPGGGGGVEKETDAAIDNERERMKRNLFLTAAKFTPSMNRSSPVSDADLTLVAPPILPVSTSTSTNNPNHNANNNTSVVLTPAEPHAVWEGRRILLSRTLQLYGTRREAVQAGIERAGGEVLRYEGDGEEKEGDERGANPNTSIGGGGGGGGGQGWNESIGRKERKRRRRERERIEDCDVYVTRWRYGRAYVQAVREHKTIGTLAWLFHVQSCGILTHPINQLLHYPVPKRPIEAFDKHVITVTNYTGEAREYLKKLVSSMGAEFTPSMSGKNTVLVAAYTSGTKAQKALAWSIPVVNHLWLEDCFISWRNLTVANEKYIIFRPGEDFSKRLGERGLSVGVANGISGAYGGARRVRKDGDLVAVEEDEEGKSEGDRELGRIEQEAEEIADDMDAAGVDDLGNSDDDAQEEAEERRERLRVLEEEREKERERGLQMPNGTDASLKEVMDDLVPDEGGGGVDFDMMDVDFEEGMAGGAGGAGAGLTSTPRKAINGKSPVKPNFKPSSPVSSKKTNKKPNEKKALEDSESEDEGEEDDEEEDERHKKPSKVSTSSAKKSKSTQPANKKSKSHPKSKRAASSSSSSSSEDEEDTEKRASPTPPLKKIKPSTKSKSKSKRPPSSSEDEEEEDDGEEMDVDVDSKSKSKSKRKAKEVETAVTTSKSKSSKKPLRAHPEAQEEEESTPAPRLPVISTKGKTKTNPKAQKQVVPVVDIEDEDDDEEEQEEEEEKVVPLKSKSVAKEKEKSKASEVPTMTQGGLLGKVKGDARTRIKRKSVGDKAKAKSKPVVDVESEDEEEEVVVPVKKMEKGKKNAKTKSVSQSEEEDEVAVLVTGSKGKSKSKSNTNAKSKPAGTAKTNGKTKKPVSPAVSEEEEEDIDPPPKKRPKPLPSATTPTRSKPLRVYSTAEEDEDIEDEEEEDEIPTPASDGSDEDLPEYPILSRGPRAVGKGKANGKESKTSSSAKAKQPKKPDEPKSKTKGKKKKETAPTTETETEAEEDEHAARPTTPHKSTTNANGSPLKRVVSVLMPSLKLSPSKASIGGTGNAKVAEKSRKDSKVKESVKGKKKVVVSSDEEEEEDPKPAKGKSAKTTSTAPPLTKSKPVTKASTSANVKSSKAKARPPPPPPSVESETEDEEEEKEVSVLVSPRSAKTKGLGRTESIRAVAGQTSVSPSKANAVASSSKTKATTTSVSVGPKSKMKGKSKAKPAEDAMDVDEPASLSNANTNDNVSTSTAPVVFATRPSRSAATKATQRLHDTIMPDLLQYEAQKKKSKRHSSGNSSSAAFALEDEERVSESQGSGVGKRRKEEEENEEEDENDGNAKKKRRVSTVVIPPDDEEEEEEAPKATTAAKVAKGKGKAKAVEEDAMDVDDVSKSTKSTIAILTTQVTLSEDVIKALNKQGVKMTSRPSECTHLLAPHVVRTEKFLCALASRAPWILQEKWATESAKAKKILPEKDYILKDKSGENRYGVNLASALQRAKELKDQGGLLKGHTFYLTPKVPVDTKLLKNVVMACGGLIATQTPTVRIINAASTTRHIISSKEDIAIWRPIVSSSKSTRIYTQELLLTGILNQQIEWEREEFWVEGSF